MRTTPSESGFDERSTVLAAQRGDRSAFTTLYERYRDRIYSLIFYSIGDELGAEDVLQIVFVKIYKGLPGFRFDASFSTWIYRITVNECLNQQRRQGTRHIPFEALLGSDDEFDKSSAVDMRHAEGERSEIIHRAVMDLTPKLRSVVALRYLEGLSYDEIASVLQCSQGTVASRLNRALSGLEARLRPLRRLL
ncbi:MAG TPA: RNA polymerase sigma factor [Blastocatellia bacterium]|jgi:RNA polymerase sigma-70 factor (ECF subfamily)|nr:RNA polymerase sigma factor [Blastocatellia bacterium]